jgi:hypothetical protein
LFLLKQKRMLENKIVVVFLLVLFESIYNSEAINKLSNCKVELDDGSIIDLTSLDNANSPRFL